MKKGILILAVLFSLMSCSSDDGINFFYEPIAIENIEIADEFIRGQTHEITVTYFRPSSCHNFDGFDYNRNNNERFVAIISTVFNDRACDDLAETDSREATINFLAGSEESYIFNFWQGRDANGENQFLTIEVPVVEVSTND